MIFLLDFKTLKRHTMNPGNWRMSSVQTLTNFDSFEMFEADAKIETKFVL